MAYKSKGYSLTHIAVFLLFVLCVLLFVKRQRSYYSDKHPILDELRRRISLVDPSFAKIPLKIGDSAYTENKEVITLCLQRPDTGDFYDMNTLVYVLLHEVAHVKSTTVGHKGEFPKKFAELLRQAARKGIYDPRIPVAQSYCGTSS